MRRANLLQTVLLAFLVSALVIQMAFSIRWPITLDESPLLYETFLMQTEGRMPYRDIFDFQMPGAYLAYDMLGYLSGFNALPLRIIDLLILVALSIFTFLIMKNFGKPSAFAAIFLFGLKYMQGSAYMSLQREYLFLFLISIAVWMNMRKEMTFRTRLITGILFGLASTIKPHAALGLIPLIGFDLADLIRTSKLTPLRATALILLPIGVGFSIPILLVILWLAVTGALLPFIEIVRNYWPLYSQINGYLQVTDTVAKFQFTLLRLIFMDGNWVWLIPAGIGLYFLPQEKRRSTYLLASLAVCYAIYPALSGQFFTYHYIPFVYFILLLASLSLAVPPSKKNLALLALAIVIIANIRPSSAFARQLIGTPISPINDRAEEIGGFLKANLKAGDAVQPLDWTSGTLLAMLETRALLATPYIFDFYFYHHVSSPYIQNLRADFMKDLQAAKPRFVIEVLAEDKPWVTGLDTSRKFPELHKFLNENYSVVVDKGDYLIYERR